MNHIIQSCVVSKHICSQHNLSSWYHQDDIIKMYHLDDCHDITYVMRRFKLISPISSSWCHQVDIIKLISSRCITYVMRTLPWPEWVHQDDILKMYQQPLAFARKLCSFLSEAITTSAPSAPSVWPRTTHTPVRRARLVPDQNYTIAPSAPSVWPELKNGFVRMRCVCVWSTFVGARLMFLHHNEILQKSRVTERGRIAPLVKKCTHRISSTPNL